jgi:hypothetical protein
LALEEHHIGDFSLINWLSNSRKSRFLLFFCTRSSAFLFPYCCKITYDKTSLPHSLDRGILILMKMIMLYFLAQVLKAKEIDLTCIHTDSIWIIKLGCCSSFFFKQLSSFVWVTGRLNFYLIEKLIILKISYYWFMFLIALNVNPIL